MWSRFTLSAVTIALQTACLITLAQAQGSGIDCDSFEKDSDGSWTVLHRAYIPGPNIKVEEGVIFRPGQTFLGDDMAAKLNKACPKQAMAPPPEPVQAQVPLAPLSRFADANGNIDVQRLACGHLADTSTAEASLLLTWYSGWYNGLAKKRGINLARVRYVTQSVIDYCKANRDKSLVQAMESMLK